MKQSTNIVIKIVSEGCNISSFIHVHLNKHVHVLVNAFMYSVYVCTCIVCLNLSILFKVIELCILKVVTIIGCMENCQCDTRLHI